MLERLLARQDPARPAVVAGNVRLTYGELFDRVSAFAVRLRACGVRRGDCIVVVLSNSIEFIVALFAAAKMNCAAFTLDPAVGRAVVQGAARSCSARIVVTARAQFALCDGTELVAIDPADVSDGQAIAEKISDDAGSEQDQVPFLLQYSSGVTGLGKRIGRTQQNLVAEAQNFTTAVRLQASDRIICTVPLFHAHGMGNCLLAALHAGASLVLADLSGAPTETILELIEREAVTIFPGVPFIFDALALSPESLRPDLGSLRLCFSAGNFLSHETFCRFFDRYGIAIRQLYGCTEAGSLTLNLSTAVLESWNSVGTPLGNVQLKIHEGEIAIRSPALAAGYLDAPELNQVAFRDGWFFTGDLGRFDGQKRLYIVGRKCAIVDVGGRKVDPREVEEVILQHPAAAEVAVVGIGHGPQTGLLKAVIVARQPCGSADITAHCKDRLAAFKCPSLIEFVDRLPKTALGKIKRGELIASALASDIGRSLPALERFLRRELSVLLERDAASIDSSQLILEQGISSAQAVQLAARIQVHTAIPVPATLIWNYPTIAAIARWIRDRMIAGIPPAPVSAPARLDKDGTGVPRIDETGRLT